MYESFYGFKEKPFNLTPDPDFLFMSHGHENAYTHLDYAVVENKGFVVITGEIGSGKTTLINYLLNNISKDTHVGILNHTSVLPLQFMKMICREFELDVKDKDKAGLLEAFHGFLLRQFSGNRRVILIIDEAQNLPPKTMEEIRMLSNLEAEKQPLIQIILAGQPELRLKLQRRDLEQLAQRVTAYCHIDSLSEEEVRLYIRHRLKVAGGENPDMFENGAVTAVYEHSRGIPRTINVLCDTALVYGYADEMTAIDRIVIEEVVKARTGGRESVIPSSPSETAPEEPGISEEWETGLKALEDRLRMLEDQTLRMDQVLALWTDRLAKRDRIVIELFTMLKQSLESRMDLVKKLGRLEDQKATGKPKFSPFSFFRRNK